MPTVDVTVLRDAVVAGKPIAFLVDEATTESIVDANQVQIDDQKYPLDSTTNFFNEDKPQQLKAVLFCWFHDKSSIVDYKNECSKNGIQDFKFLVKTELTTWLSGNSDTCKFVKSDNKPDSSASELSKGDSSSGGKKRKLEDPQLDRIHGFERESVDHNITLRGSKNIDFGYLVKDARVFIGSLKRSKSVKATSNGRASNLKSPIVIVSPSTSALLTLSNIKEFLEESKFVEPNPSLKRPANGVVTVNHNFERLNSAAHQITIVDNIDMFTKPEYWDRVVAIFTTGQAWQFAKYKYSKPELLFQRYAGYFVTYQGDVVPQQVKDWNVNEIRVDRGDRRFRDKMIVKDFFADIEKILFAKGYGI